MFSRLIRWLGLLSTCLVAHADPVRPFTIDTVMADLAKSHPQATRVAAELPPGIVSAENLTYRRVGDVELQLDIYRPDSKEKLPAVLIVHGGGWLAGDRTMERPFAQHLAARGFVGVPVSYRLGTPGRFPAPIHDLKAAVRWLRAHAAEYGIDPARIAAVGGSAGGTLVTMLGATNGQPELEGNGDDLTQSSVVQAIANLDGSVLFASNALIESSRKRPDHPYWEYVHGSYAAQRAVWVAASPLFYCTSQSAPTLFVKSTVTQPILSGREEMAARLRILGVPTEEIVYAGAPHPFWLVHPWFDRALDDVTRFFQSHLAAR